MSHRTVYVQDEDGKLGFRIIFDSMYDNELVEDIKNLDILNMTPLDAMNALYNLQSKAKKLK